jgi:hypothetical protein
MWYYFFINLKINRRCLMPVIKVWCLPDGLSEEQLKDLYQKIVTRTRAVEQLKLGEKDITVLFPTDHMKFGLGEEIIVEIGNLFRKPERTDEVLNRLCRELGEMIKVEFPNAFVECTVKTINPLDGYWDSVRGNEEAKFILLLRAKKKQYGMRFITFVENRLHRYGGNWLVQIRQEAREQYYRSLIPNLGRKGIMVVRQVLSEMDSQKK